MEKKKVFMILGITLGVIVVAAAAFIGGSLLNGGKLPFGMGSLFSSNGSMSEMEINMEPAPELPTTEPILNGLMSKRSDNTLSVQDFSQMASSQGSGGVVTFSADSTDGSVDLSVSGSGNAAAAVEVVVTEKTIIYQDTTDFTGMEVSGTIQQTVAEGSLDDLSPNSFVTVWGRKTGDRIIADVICYSNPIMLTQ